jgi:protein-tyrosine kinase
MGKVSRALDKSGQGYTIKPRGYMQRGGASSEHHEISTETEGDQQSYPVGAVPQTSLWDERLLKVTGVSGHLSELFRVLRSRILLPATDGKKLETVLVTSTAPGEGKSFISANLAISLARGMDQYCLLVDCDLRRPSLAKLFGMANDPGLSEYLQTKCDVTGLIQKTSIAKLSLLASGQPPTNPSELLGSSCMHGFVQELTARYDDRFIIFDSPPIKAASETSVLARHVDGVVLVVRWGASGRDHVKRVIEDIGREKIIGIVFNGYKSNLIESKVFKYSDYYQYDYTYE